MDIEKFISKLESLDIDLIINEAIKQNEKKILKLNTDVQLYKEGITNTGSRITPKYAKSTIKRKQRLGQPSDRVTLRDKGTWEENAFYIQYEKDQIIIAAKPTLTQRSFDLTGWLVHRYKKEILGFTNLSIDILREIIEPTIMKLINQRYGT